MTTQAAAAVHRARIARSWDESTTLRGIALEVDEPVAASYASPGQYLKVTASPGVEGYFALATAPGRPFELLVRRGAAVADALAALSVGAEVQVTAAQGKGYPVGEHAGKDLVLLAAGSGIAPLRAVVQHVVSDRSRFGAVRLYYGHRHAHEFAYTAEEPAWIEAGVSVRRVVSDGDAGWSGPRGHVQDVFRAESGRLDDTVFYLCGMKKMVADVHALLGELGIDRGRSFLNY